MLRWVKAVNIGEEVACGVANTSIGVTGTAENLIRDSHLAAKVCRGNPQAQNVGAHIINHFLWGNHIADGLRHLATMFINGKTMGQNRLVRGCAINRNSRLKRRLKPTAVLI